MESSADPTRDVVSLPAARTRATFPTAVPPLFLDHSVARRFHGELRVMTIEISFDLDGSKPAYFCRTAVVGCCVFSMMMCTNACRDRKHVMCESRIEKVGRREKRAQQTRRHSSQCQPFSNPGTVVQWYPIGASALKMIRCCVVVFGLKLV